MRAVLKRIDDPNAKEVIWEASYNVSQIPSATQTNENNVYYPIKQDLNGDYFTPSVMSWQDIYQEDYFIGKMHNLNNVDDVIWPLWYQQYPDNITFSNQNISTGDYFARKTITIGPNVTFDPNCIFTAGRNVKIVQGTIIPPGVILKTGIEPECTRAVNQVSNTDIASFCSSAKYKPNFTSTPSSIIQSSEVYNDIIDVKLYPNPTSTTSTLDIYSLQNESLNFTLENLEGQVIRNSKFQIENGINKYNINLTDFAPGIYFLKILRGDGSFIKTVKIVRYK